jgi:shikimate kinase
MSYPNIYLNGFMGAGKTEVGSLLSKRLGWKWIDIDDQIQWKTGKSISELFDTKGEVYFRDLESEIIFETSFAQKCVVSLGGGSCIRSKNHQRLKESGILIYLYADIATLLRRIYADHKTRPLLKSDHLQEVQRRAQALFEQRKNIYEDSYIQLNTVGKRPQDLVDQILEVLMIKNSSSLLQ